MAGCFGEILVNIILFHINDRYEDFLAVSQFDVLLVQSSLAPVKPVYYRYSAGKMYFFFRRRYFEHL